MRKKNSSSTPSKKVIDNSLKFYTKDPTDTTINACNDKTSGAFKLTFCDDFVSDSGNWEVYVGQDPTNSCAIYDKECVKVQSGKLTINPKVDQGTPEPPKMIKSGRIHSKNKYKFGYFEARIQIDGMSPFAWPAFWLLADNEVLPWPAAGEIDILETCNAGKNGLSLQCSPYNWALSQQGKSPTAYIDTNYQYGMDYKNYHVFAVHWYKSGDDIFVDYYYDAVMTADGPKDGKDSSLKTPVNPVFSRKIPGDGTFGDCIRAARNGMDPYGRRIATAPGDYTPYEYPMKIIFNLAIGQGICTDPGACAPGNCACPGFNRDLNYNVDWVRVWQT
jgi:hypothetical protein